MLEYILPFSIYILTGFLKGTYALIIKFIVCSIIIAFFWKKYKLRTYTSYISILTGLVIAILWIVLTPKYQIASFIPSDYLSLIFKIMNFVFIAPIIEELITRSFIPRILINSDYEKIPVGSMNLSSFILSTVFFTIAHKQWIAAAVVSVILNLLLLKTKRIESVITGHFVANVFLVLYIIMTNSWNLW